MNKRTRTARRWANETRERDETSTRKTQVLNIILSPMKEVLSCGHRIGYHSFIPLHSTCPFHSSIYTLASIPFAPSLFSSPPQSNTHTLPVKKTSPSGGDPDNSSPVNQSSFPVKPPRVGQSSICEIHAFLSTPCRTCACIPCAEFHGQIPYCSSTLLELATQLRKNFNVFGLDFVHPFRINTFLFRTRQIRTPIHSSINLLVPVYVFAFPTSFTIGISVIDS